MREAKTVGPITCNPETGDFEATVAVNDGTAIRHVPCRLRFPVDASMSSVVPALARQAEVKLAMTRVAPHIPQRPGRGAAA